METANGKIVTTELPTLAPVVEIKTVEKGQNPLYNLFPPTEIISSDKILAQADFIKKRVHDATLLNENFTRLDELVYPENVQILSSHGFVIRNNPHSKTAIVSWISNGHH
jgi:hypothetical protein